MLIYLDSASASDVEDFADDERIAGHTLNPSLCQKAGVKGYESHCRHILSLTDKPVSIQVLADDLPTMEQQARQIASWGENVVVKIPIQTTTRTSTVDLVKSLSDDGLLINVTAVFTRHQVVSLLHANPHIVSIFAGRIADTGVDPFSLVQWSRGYLSVATKVLWASPRCAWDYYQAYRAWADIITMTPTLIEKLWLKSYDLNEFSRDTVAMFLNDADAMGYTL